jgi:hypothetical protein
MMSAPAISHADLCQKVQDFRIVQVFGATFNPAVTHPDLPPGEAGVLEYFIPEGRKFVFGTSGFTVPGSGFVPYQDAVWLGWADRDVEQKGDHKKYLMINFRERLPITMHVGGASVPLGGLIKVMQMLTGLEPKKD